MNFVDITLGQVVYSKAGRDSGKRFLITGIENDLYVLIADGDLRRLEKPKRKKIKHLGFTDTVIDAIGTKLRDNARVTNADIRKALKEV